MHPAPPAGPITRSSPLSGRRIVRSLTSRPKPSPLARQPLHRWRASEPAFLAGESVIIAGFIDHGGPEPLDEILVEFEGGEERTVHRGELTIRFDVIEGQWSTREVHLAGGRLNPGESLAVVPHAPDGFRWGCGSGAAQLALAILLRATDRETALAHHQAFNSEIIATLPHGDFSLRLATVHEWLAARASA